MKMPAWLMGFALVLSTGMVTALAQNTFDVLEQPARQTPLALRSAIIGVEAIDGKLIGVGNRGHILVAEDQLASLQQKSVPVSADLTAVHFHDNQLGWVVGHDGVVLRTLDGGKTWKRLLDGNELNDLVVTYYEALQSQNPALEITTALADARRSQSAGAGVGLMDVWFRDHHEGYIVGAFGLILQTLDGGESWIPQMHLVENPGGMHLYAVSGDANDIYIVGEQGLFLHRGESGAFAAIQTPYHGTFFGLTLDEERLALYGLRGHAFLTSNRGETWQALEAETSRSFVSGLFWNGSLLLLDQAGALFQAPRSELRLEQLAQVRGPVTSMDQVDQNTLVFGTFSGLMELTLEN